MKRRRVSAAAMVVAALVFGGVTSAAAMQPETVLTAADVVRLGAERDGERVLLEGEAIGEALRAEGDRRWVNVLSGGVAIGVVLDGSKVEEIQSFGRYGQAGSVLRVEGVYNAACDRHGGDRDVHGESIDVIHPGVAGVEPVETWKFAPALALFVIAGVGGARLRSERRRFRSGGRSV